MDLIDPTNRFLKELARFKLSYDVTCYMKDRVLRDWRSFEDEQHQNYPIKACGIIASEVNVADWTPSNETILNLEEDLAPEETGSEIDSFPQATVAVTYIFSLLEGYGNYICDQRCPEYRKKNGQAWHHGVYGNADLESRSKRVKMKNNFCKPFRIEGPMLESVPMEIVEALVNLKKTRNKIIHDLEHTRDFETFFRATVAIACCIFTMCDEKKRTLKVFPWEDHHGKYRI